MRSYILTNSQWNEFNQQPFQIRNNQNQEQIVRINPEEEAENLQLRDRNITDIQNRETRQQLLEVFPNLPILDNVEESEQLPEENNITSIILQPSEQINLNSEDFCLRRTLIRRRISQDEIIDRVENPSPDQVYHQIQFEDEICNEQDKIKENDNSFDKKEELSISIPKICENPESRGSHSNISKD